ncbi:hypothetical protein BDB01DRAFT_897252 [Pilobolus umbonatus]|nr:hypothetical protein BDB01DRAFT_897252 [Pilobolus umbonatus]
MNPEIKFVHVDRILGESGYAEGIHTEKLTLLDSLHRFEMLPEAFDISLNQVDTFLIGESVGPTEMVKSIWIADDASPNTGRLALYTKKCNLEDQRANIMRVFKKLVGVSEEEEPMGLEESDEADEASLSYVWHGYTDIIYLLVSQRYGEFIYYNGCNVFARIITLHTIRKDLMSTTLYCEQIIIWKVPGDTVAVF